jgi:hypothetical protein
MSNLNKLNQRRRELLNYLEQAKSYKSETVKLIENLENRFYHKEINSAEFSYRLKDALKGRTAKQWFDYYNDLIKDYNKEVTYSLG